MQLTVLLAENIMLDICSTNILSVIACHDSFQICLVWIGLQKIQEISALLTNALLSLHFRLYTWIFLLHAFFNHKWTLMFQIEAPIHSSNVMLYSKEKNIASRVGHKVLDDGKKVRYLIKTGEIIDNAESWKKVKEESKKTEVAATTTS